MLLSAASTVADQPVLMQGCAVVVNATTTEGEALRYTKWLDKLEEKTTSCYFLIYFKGRTGLEVKWEADTKVGNMSQGL